MSICPNGCGEAPRRFAAVLHPSLLPAAAVALLPKCPLCWAAWTGAAAAFGLGRVGFSPWLLPASAVLLGLVLAVVAWRAWRRKLFTAAALFLVGGALVAGGRLVLDSTWALSTGLAVLLAAGFAVRRRPDLCRGAAGTLHAERRAAHRRPPDPSGG